MTKGKNQHVVPVGKQWGVIGEGNEKKTVIVPTQKEAIQIARKIAQNQESELLIHGENVKIRARDSHGHDSFPPKG